MATCLDNAVIAALAGALRVRMKYLECPVCKRNISGGRKHFSHCPHYETEMQAERLAGSDLPAVQ